MTPGSDPSPGSPHPARSSPARTAALGLLLVALWLALWRDLSVANLLSGTAVATVALWLARRGAPPPTSDDGRHVPVHLRPLPAARYLLRFAVDLVVASVRVARDTLRRRIRIAPGIAEIRVPNPSPTAAALVANTITLTPGTLTLDVTPRGEGWDLRIHVLQHTDPDVLTADLEDIVHRALEVLGLEATS